MNATTGSETSKFGPPFYACEQCDGVLQRITDEDERRVALHKILHVPDRKERWKLLSDWRSEHAPPARSVVLDLMADEAARQFSARRAPDQSVR